MYGNVPADLQSKAISLCVCITPSDTATAGGSLKPQHVTAKEQKAWEDLCPQQLPPPSPAQPSSIQPNPTQHQPPSQGQRLSKGLMGGRWESVDFSHICFDGLLTPVILWRLLKSPPTQLPLINVVSKISTRAIICTPLRQDPISLCYSLSLCKRKWAQIHTHTQTQAHTQHNIEPQPDSAINKLNSWWIQHIQTQRPPENKQLFKVVQMS